MKGKRFKTMRFDNTEDDDSRPDYFSEDSVPEPEEKKEEPRFSRDDPRYWDQERRPWNERRRGFRWGLMMAILSGFIILGGLIAFYMRFFVAYADDCTEYGYIESIENRGTVFKTYEGVLISYKDLMDSTRRYNRDFIFSTPNSQLGKIIASQARNGRPVMMRYKKYHATVPWRGESKKIVVSIDTIDAKKILHPDAMPDYLKK